MSRLDQMAPSNYDGPESRHSRIAPPFAAPHNLKRQFWLEFNNYLRAALTLRGVSSAKCRALPVHATSALSLPTVWKLRSSTESGLLSPVAYRQPGNTSDSVRHAEPV
jgi:hypothetical protein